MSRTIFLHWGLPRTGTTAFQACLGEHARALAAQSILYPRMGWRGSPHPAHHNIAWQLIGDPRFSTARGRIDDLMLELREHDGNVLLSSEDFVITPHHPEQLSGFVSQLRQLGYRLVVVLVLRHQREFAYSLYAEMVAHQGCSIGFADYLAAICSTGELRYKYWRQPFNFQAYLRLLEPFFPEIRIIPFDSRGPETQADFMASLLQACGIDPTRLPAPKVMNRSASPWKLLRSHHRNCHGVITRSVDAVLLQIRKLYPHIEHYTPAEAALLDASFAATNEAIEQAYQFQFNMPHITTPPARGPCFSDVFRVDFHRMLVAVADRDPTSRLHRWMHHRISHARPLP